jgi:NCS1 family nucleobase:cation symporter-1
MSSFSSYIFGWLVGYSGLLGPIAGIMVTDYFIIRRKQLRLDDLYRRNGIYEYSSGVNYRAMIALAAGVMLALSGLFIHAVHWFYDYAWFTGFFISGGLYTLLMFGSRQKNSDELLMNP